MKVKMLRNCHVGGDLLEAGAEYDISDATVARDLVAMKRAEAVDPSAMKEKQTKQSRLSVKKTRDAEKPDGETGKGKAGKGGE